MFSSLIFALLATIHMLAAGLAAMGPLLVTGLLFSPLGGDPLYRAPLRRVAWWSLVALVVAGLVGLMAGLLRHLVEGDGYASMLGRFPAQLYLFTTVEWLFALGCLTVWYRAWEWGKRHPWLHGLLMLVAATNLVYHFPPLMIVQNLLVERPTLVAEQVIERRIFLSAMLSGEILARVFHFLALALSFSAACVVLGIAPADDESGKIYRRCGWTGMVSTCVQIVTGVMILLLAPPDLATRVTGANWPATGIQLTVVGIAVLLLVRWSQLALGHPPRRIETGLVRSIAAATLLMSLVARL